MHRNGAPPNREKRQIPKKVLRAQNIFRDRAPAVEARRELPNRRKVLGWGAVVLGLGGAAAFGLHKCGEEPPKEGGNVREGGVRAMVRPKVGYGRYVGKPVPLRPFRILPCKKPPNIDKPLEWGEKYGKEGTMKTEGWSGVITTWAHWCNPCIYELGFFRMLHEEMGMPVTGIQQRERAEDARTLEETWESVGSNLYFRHVDSGEIAFPQLAMHSENIDRMQNDAGVARGKESYPFNAIVVDGRIVYWANAVWDDRIWVLENPGKDADIKERIRVHVSPKEEAEFRESAKEFVSVAKYFLRKK